MYDICDSVMQSARIESASWTRRMREMAATADPR
jgi:hypothetical protein